MLRVGPIMDEVLLALGFSMLRSVVSKLCSGTCAIQKMALRTAQSTLSLLLRNTQPRAPAPDLQDQTLHFNTSPNDSCVLKCLKSSVPGMFSE